MNEQEKMKKLIVNQNIMILKLKALDLEVKAALALAKQVNGLSTALLGAGLLTKEGIELHQSFEVKKPEEKTEESL
ncbi:MAG: hypothetical protein WA082_04545 [Candidatus Moraniibacteriota bacterium]